MPLRTAKLAALAGFRSPPRLPALLYNNSGHGVGLLHAQALVAYGYGTPAERPGADALAPVVACIAHAVDRLRVSQ